MIGERKALKRKSDYEILIDWIQEGSTVLDLGCGNGKFLETITRVKNCRGVGVDNDPQRIFSCIERGVCVYQGDVIDGLQLFDDHSFDWVVCSRTLQDLSSPGLFIKEALRVSTHVAVGFVNFGFWENRLSFFLRGERVRNTVFPEQWHESTPVNPVTLRGFEEFCRQSGIEIESLVCLGGDWESEVTCWRSLRAGYVLSRLSNSTVSQR